MPSQQWTFNTLKAAIQHWPENDSNERYNAHITDFIGLGELRLVRDLDLEIFDTEDTSISTAVGFRIILKPSTAILVRSVGYIDPVSGYVPLKLRAYDYCKAYSPLIATQGTPQFYAEWSPTQIYVVDTPNAILPLHFHIMGRPLDLLSASTPDSTSWLSVRVPDALLAACLMESEHYTQADDRYDDYKTKYYEELLPAARFELRQLRRSGDYSPFEPAARSR